MLAMVITAPEPLRSQLRGLSRTQLVAACMRLRPDLSELADPPATKIALRSVATRARALDREARALNTQLYELTTTFAPATSAIFGLGSDTTASLLVAIGDNPDWLRSEAAFAHLRGVAPIPASSGKTHRHRLHRGGDRAGNRALHIAVVVRLRYDPRSRAYANRRRSDGLTTPEIIRCQKRYLAREVFRALRADYTQLTT
ncbi:MAG: transposase [Pseudonocardiaceae bacterium]